MTKAEDRERRIADSVLDRIAVDGNSSDHQVVVGGDAESNERVLQHVEDGIRDDPALYTRRAGVRIGGDDDRPTSIADLWAKAVEELMPHCDNPSLRTMGRQAIREWEERERPPREPSLEALALTITATRNERTVLLVSRLDEVLGYLEEDDDTRFRMILDAEPSIIVVGTAGRLDDRNDAEHSLFHGMEVQENNPGD